MTRKQFVVLEHARTDTQRTAMERIRIRGECPFCPENLPKEHKKPILRERLHWIVTENQWPYENTRVHLLVIARRHVERLGELPPGAGEELLTLLKEIEHHKEITSGAIGIRFGEPERNGGTVRHLHVQVLVAEITDKSDPHYKPVKFKMG